MECATVNKKYVTSKFLELAYLLFKAYFIWYCSGIPSHTIITHVYKGPTVLVEKYKPYEK